MRLICPNCEAQYEVPDEVVPDEGRDVQCSNCGQTWYQHHPDHMPPEAAPVPPEDDDLDDGEEPVVTPPRHAPVASAPVPDTSDDADDEDDDRDDATGLDDDARRQLFGDDNGDDDYDEEYEDENDTPPLQQRQVDPAVSDILRQEAAREAQARAKESDPLESQPDLGLSAPAEDEADRRAREARDRMARMRGQTPPEDPGAVETAAAAVALGSRRDLLPDIEEINSTLRSDNDRYGDGEVHASDDEVIARRRGGFGRGFTLTVLLFVILALIYIYAPALARAVPALDPMLNSYVAQVDAARIWFDAQVRGILTWLDATAASQES